MTKLSISTRAAAVLGALALTAATAAAMVASPIFPLASGSGGGAADADMTVSIRASSDAAPTVIHVPDLAVGESRTIRSDGGKDVLVTRTEDGLTVKIGARDFQIRLPGEGGGHVVELGGPGHEDVRTIVTGDGMKKVIVTKHGYGFSTGDGHPAFASASQLLEKHPLAALDGADARTRDLVAKALDELVKKGLVIAPMLENGLPGAADGERVEIKVTRKGEEQR